MLNEFLDLFFTSLCLADTKPHRTCQTYMEWKPSREATSFKINTAQNSISAASTPGCLLLLITDASPESNRRRGIKGRGISGAANCLSLGSFLRKPIPVSTFRGPDGIMRDFGPNCSGPAQIKVQPTEGEDVFEKVTSAGFMHSFIARNLLRSTLFSHFGSASWKMNATEILAIKLIPIHIECPIS
ncbi:hypothetical protein CDAR_539021 [Caerostris darwini]|uniref:Uncharacterized protein n=1 Tax=Caerostris darwini TaxID=1538125 RepID=A0AAV4T1S4_9ARAC|nr:hypothetical protein CDAR_539021 [Caerostris darwini]